MRSVTIISVHRPEYEIGIAAGHGTSGQATLMRGNCPT